MKMLAYKLEIFDNFVNLVRIRMVRGSQHSKTKLAKSPHCLLPISLRVNDNVLAFLGLSENYQMATLSVLLWDLE